MIAGIRHRAQGSLEALLTLCLLTLAQTLPAQSAGSAITYTHQIAPLLFKNCTPCHHSGGSGPFSLMTYADAKRWSSSIQTVTQSRYMPPWLPAPGHGDFLGNRRLSDDDIALVRHWVDQGTLEGELTAKPAPPVYATDWQLGKPDLILEVDSSMRVPASGSDLFRNFILPFPLQQSRWIRAMEIKPGSPRVVHHANLILDRTGSLRRTHPAWRDGIPGMDVIVDSGDTFDPDGYFLDWKPDSTALIEPDGMAWRLDPGNDLVLNMHLKPTGKVESVRARIGLYFTASPPTKFPILVQLEHDAALRIPAGDAGFTVEDHLTLPEAADVLAVYPHAHYLGKRLEGWAELPDGARRDLILIPDWDIDRQSIYRFASPVTLPAETTLHMRYTYDNSAENPHNPHVPPILVHNGNNSTDEMGHLWLQLLPHPPASAAAGQNPEDPRDPILQAWMERSLQKNPGDPTALFNLASLDMAAGQNPQAATLITEALASKPSDARMLTALASALDRSGDFEHARERLHQAVTADPAYVDAHFDLGTIDLEHGQDVEAEAQFRAALTLRPRDVGARLGLASVLAAGNRDAQARPEFLKAADAAGDDPDQLLRVAIREAQAGLAPDAIVLLRTLSVRLPDRLDVREGLVALYAQGGQSAEAIAEQRAATRIAPSDPAQWNNLGALLARTGDRPEATAAFQKALSLDPTNAAATRSLNLLQSHPVQ